MTANVRIVLWALLGLAVILNVQTWNHDYPAKPATIAAAPNSSLDDSVPNAAPASGAATAPATSSGELGAAPPGAAAAAPTPAPASPAPAVGVAPAAKVAGNAEVVANEAGSGAAAGRVHVVTDVLDLWISLAGGELTCADLPTYPLVKKETTPVRLFNRASGPAACATQVTTSDTPADPLYVLQSGLAPGQPGASAPTHQAIWASSTPSAELAAGSDELRVPLTWSAGGVNITKTFVFHRGSYRIDLDYTIANQSAEAVSYAPYSQILRDNTPIKSSMFKAGSNAFKGPAIYDGTKYEKLKVTDGNMERTITGGWLAALQHHFTAAMVPPAGEPWRFSLRSQGSQYLLLAAGPAVNVAPGATAALQETLFVGPKLQSQLEATGTKLALVTDYGRLTFLAQPLFWLLDKVHALIGNWGITIIIATFLLKLLFYPLSEASGKSMAKMKAVQPRIKTLQETYKDDRQKLGQEMMQLYQREKINPLAGCLPLLIQMPVFLAFYWVLLESVEMRQAPFMGWIHDLSSRDPLFILPAIMAGAMFVQYKLNPQMGTDPVQQKVFMLMPLAMSVMFAFFPAGLVLYWVTNTLLSIAQQWNINRRIEAAGARARR